VSSFTVAENTTEFGKEKRPAPLNAVLDAE